MDDLLCAVGGERYIKKLSRVVSMARPGPWDFRSEEGVGYDDVLLYSNEKFAWTDEYSVIFPCNLRNDNEGSASLKKSYAKCDLEKPGETREMRVERMDLWKSIPPHGNVLELRAGRLLESHESRYTAVSVMERMDCTLEQLIYTDKDFLLGCTYEHLLAIIKQVCMGLAHLHKNGFIHFDLQPRNVLVSKAEDGKLVVKIAGFDLLKAIKPGENSVEQRSRGTEAYMAPEVLAADPETDGHVRFTSAADVYSLGVIIWEILNRQKPQYRLNHRGRNGRKIVWPTVGRTDSIWCEGPLSLCDIVESCLSFKDSSPACDIRSVMEQVLQTLKAMKDRESEG